MSNTNEAQTAASAVATKPHVEKYHFKAMKQGSKGFESLKEMVDTGKLSMSDIVVEKNDDGIETWKRKSEEHTFNVPVVSDLVQADVLSGKQQQYLQDLLADHITSKNREVVDKREGEFKSWEAILDNEYSQRKAATTVSKEELAKSVEILKAALTELGMGEKPINAIADAASKKFNANACAVFMRNAGVLEKIRNAVESAYEQIAGTEFEDEAAASFALWLGNIDKALAKDDDLDADAFAL